jgi:hypothetical protein
MMGVSTHSDPLVVSERDDDYFLRKVEATYRPRLETTVRPHLLQFIGSRYQWLHEGTMDEGVYVGQSIWRVVGHRQEPLSHYWVPAEDLADAKCVGQWCEDDA